MKLIALNSIHMSGDKIAPGNTFECDDEDTLKHLLDSDAAVPSENPVEEDVTGTDSDVKNDSDVTDTDTSETSDSVVSDPVEELEKIGGVTKKIALELMKNSIDSVDKVAVLSVDELEAIKGITRKTAEKIFNSFEDAA